MVLYFLKFTNKIRRNSRSKPLNISSTDVLRNCNALRLSGYSIKIIWSGYDDNCKGRNPLETSIKPTRFHMFFSIDLMSFFCFSSGMGSIRCAGICKYIKFNDHCYRMGFPRTILLRICPNISVFDR